MKRILSIAVLLSCAIQPIHAVSYLSKKQKTQRHLTSLRLLRELGTPITMQDDQTAEEAIKMEVAKALTRLKNPKPKKSMGSIWIRREPLSPDLIQQLQRKAAAAWGEYRKKKLNKLTQSA